MDWKLLLPLLLTIAEVPQATCCEEFECFSYNTLMRAYNNVPRGAPMKVFEKPLHHTSDQDGSIVYESSKELLMISKKSNTGNTETTPLIVKYFETPDQFKREIMTSSYIASSNKARKNKPPRHFQFGKFLVEIELHPSPFYARVIGIFTKKGQTDSFQDQFMTAIEKILQEPRSETYQHMADIASLHNVIMLIQTVLIEDPDIKNVNEGLQRYELGQEIKDAIKTVTETQITVAMVYAETVRNFRTLAVNIVSVKLYPKSREPRADTELKEMFKDMKTFISEYYTMSRRGTWADKNSVPDTDIFSVERSKALMAKFSKKTNKEDERQTRCIG